MQPSVSMALQKAEGAWIQCGGVQGLLTLSLAESAGERPGTGCPLFFFPVISRVLAVSVQRS